MIVDITIAVAITGLGALIGWYYYNKGFKEGCLATSIIFKYYDNDAYEAAVNKLKESKTDVK